jgi:phospholipase A-2-activating protein
LPGGNEPVGGISLDKLPGLDALQLPGSRHGENKVVRNGNVAEAYQWNNQEKEWVKLGEVVTQSDNMDTDKQYDYVFDVDIGDGQIRKLGYNNHENPYTVAQEFLWKQELDQGWLDTVAQFIVKNSKSITIGETSTQQPYADPYTGGQRYVPQETNPQVTSQSVKQPTHFPLKAPLVFDTANYSAI